MLAEKLKSDLENNSRNRRKNSVTSKSVIFSAASYLTSFLSQRRPFALPGLSLTSSEGSTSGKLASIYDIPQLITSSMLIYEWLLRNPLAWSLFIEQNDFSTLYGIFACCYVLLINLLDLSFYTLNLTDLFVQLMVELPDSLLLLKLNLNIVEILLDQPQVISIWENLTETSNISSPKTNQTESPTLSSSLGPFHNRTLSPSQSPNGPFENLGHFLMGIFSSVLVGQKTLQMRPDIIRRFFGILKKYFQRCLDEKRSNQQNLLLITVPLNLMYPHWDTLFENMFEWMDYFSKNAHLVPLQAELSSMAQSIVLFLEFFILEGCTRLLQQQPSQVDSMYRFLASLAIRTDLIRFFIKIG